jgi:16S rRNA (cytosine1407-C5)-methyltransferase
MSRPHPFDRYVSLTDLVALREYSDRPLRKCLRVNTLKTSVSAVLGHATRRGWKLSPVPWCAEAFWIERSDYSKALGRDILHLLGHIYLQEAASMLPVALLQPQSGETIFDMCSAPGSKTTQVAAIQQGRGVIVANDVQEQRLWTLKHALHRLGVTNAIVTKKVGQWFSKHFTERFDRVLCDAPCTAQGTARKDSDALRYGSIANVEKMARLQHELLEAAVHATRVGGRIVYSTCTLAPEENEGVVADVLRRFPGQLEVVDPRTLGLGPDGLFEPAVRDSLLVQEQTGLGGGLPLLRLWPQTYDTEGFFCAVLRKVAPTRQPEPLDVVYPEARPLPQGRQDAFRAHLEAHFGTSFLQPDEQLLELEQQVFVVPQAFLDFVLPLQPNMMGLPFAKRVDDHRLRLTQEIITLRGHLATRSTIDLADDAIEAVLAGRDLEPPSGMEGDVVLRWQGVPLGSAVVSKGRLLNRLSRWMVQRA